MSIVLEPRRYATPDRLEDFARRIEARLRASTADDVDAMERLICRLMTGKDAKVAAMLASKWTEWRYGKAKETIEVQGHIEHEHFDAARLTDEQLREAEHLVESAHTSSDQG